MRLIGHFKRRDNDVFVGKKIKRLTLLINRPRERQRERSNVGGGHFE